MEWWSEELCTAGWLVCLDVGREKLVGLDGGDEKLALGEVGEKFEDAARGISGRNGPSNAVAGDSGLLPGIVARPDLVTGGVDCKVGLLSRPGPDVSQWSKG
jgi:hypothetical protein